MLARLLGILGVLLAWLGRHILGILLTRLGRVLVRVLLTLGAVLIGVLLALRGLLVGVLLTLGRIRIWILLAGSIGIGILLPLRRILGILLVLGRILLALRLAVLAVLLALGLAVLRILLLARLLGILGLLGHLLIRILRLSRLGAVLALFGHLLRRILALLGYLLRRILALLRYLLRCILALLWHLLGCVLRRPHHLLGCVRLLGQLRLGGILGVQIGAQLIHRCIALLGADGHALVQCGALPRCQAGDQGPVDGQILHHPVGGIGRNFAGGAVEDVGAEGVNVRPGAQGTPALILLDGGEAMLQNGLGGLGQILLRVLALHVAHSAEVQELDTAVGEDHDVVGTDVPVDDTRLVHRDHGFHDGAQDLQGLLNAKTAAVHVHVAPQVNALDVLHDNVGSIMLHEKVTNVHNTRHA